MKGICPKCGACYYGWALASPQAQRCGACGSILEVSRDDSSVRSAVGLRFKAGPHHLRSDGGTWDDALKANLQFFLSRN
jgi:hypothetical protein